MAEEEETNDIVGVDLSAYRKQEAEAEAAYKKKEEERKKRAMFLDESSDFLANLESSLSKSSKNEDLMKGFNNSMAEALTTNDETTTSESYGSPLKSTNKSLADTTTTGGGGASDAAKEIAADVNDVDKAFLELEREERERADKQANERAFIASVKEACRGDVDKFTNFKTASGQFRRDEIGGEEYYNVFAQVVGAAQASYLLPQLLKILPDTTKVNELKAAAKALEEQVKLKNAENAYELEQAKEKALEAERLRLENEKRAKELQAQRVIYEKLAKEKAMKDSVLGRIPSSSTTKDEKVKASSPIPSPPIVASTSDMFPPTTKSVIKTPTNAAEDEGDWLKNSTPSLPQRKSTPKPSSEASIVKTSSPSSLVEPKISSLFDDSSSSSRVRGSSSEAVHISAYTGASGAAQIHDVKVGPRQTRWLPLKCTEGDVISWQFTTNPISVVDFSATFVAGLADVSVDTISGDTEFIEIFPFSRLSDCNDTFVAPANGVLKLEWDNHFSLVKPKNITCQTRKLKGEEARDASKAYQIAYTKKMERELASASSVAEKANLGKSFTARVESFTDKEDEAGKAYTAYNIVCSWEGKLEEQSHAWTIQVRYSTFLSLHDTLVELYPFEAGELPPFPGKTMFGSSSTDVAMNRQKDLSRWLVALVTSPHFLLTKEVNTFLNIKANLRFGKAEALKKVKAKRRSMQDSEAAEEHKSAKTLVSKAQSDKEKELAKNAKDPLSWLLNA